MKIRLTTEQKAFQEAFKVFADEQVFPHADQFDREEKISRQVIDEMIDEGYLGTVLPEEYGGLGLDMITFGLLNEEIGRACSSTRGLLTVHGMVSYAILRWGNQQQKEHWLPRLARGEIIGAFALTEPDVGSDAQSIETTAEKQGDEYVLNGTKKWITFGQIADVLLVFAKCDGKASAFLVERGSPGLSTEPIQGLLGGRASMIAMVHLDDCRISKENLLGGLGFGFSTVAMSALDIGRYSVAWGCVGLGQACLDASMAYAQKRKQFGKQLRRHQLIQRMLTNIITDVEAARLLCYQAGYLHDAGDPGATAKTLIAKYFASVMAPRVASDAVQIHGGNGCGSQYPVQRYLRDAKIAEIIEGSNEMQQVMISRNAYLELRRS
jgi:glutaryl-CoA dehydrogenase (non-decarboxylating)